jgi:hypothetical protein
MYENHHDFEALYQADRDQLERRLELRRKLKMAAERIEKPKKRGSLFLMLHAFRNILSN